jgi:hypothetical protein
VLDYANITPWVGVLYTPSIRYDGKYVTDPYDDHVPNLDTYYDWMRGYIDSLLQIDSPVRISMLYNTITADSDSVYMAFDVVAESDMSYNSTMRVFVSEWKHRYPYPTGPRLHAFREWLKDDLPDSVGWSFGPMTAGDSLHFELAYEIASEYRADRVVTNIFIQRNGTRKVQQSWRGEPTEALAGVEVVDIPDGAVLGRNAPNPFVGKTNISFNVKTPGRVRVGVYTLTGRLVTELADEHAEVGSHSVAWDGKDRHGRDVASGIYYYVLDTEAGRQVGKMTRLR